MFVPDIPCAFHMKCHLSLVSYCQIIVSVLIMTPPQQSENVVMLFVSVVCVV